MGCPTTTSGYFQVNVPNNGALDGIPDDVVVEVPAIVTHQGHPAGARRDAAAQDHAGANPARLAGHGANTRSVPYGRQIGAAVERAGKPSDAELRSGRQGDGGDSYTCRPPSRWPMYRMSTSTSSGLRTGDLRLCSGSRDWTGWKCRCRHHPRCSLILRPHDPHDARWCACCCARRASCRHTEPLISGALAGANTALFQKLEAHAAPAKLRCPKSFPRIKVGDLTTTPPRAQWLCRVAAHALLTECERGESGVCIPLLVDQAALGEIAHYREPVTQMNIW